MFTFTSYNLCTKIFPPLWIYSIFTLYTYAIDSVFPQKHWSLGLVVLHGLLVLVVSQDIIDHLEQSITLLIHGPWCLGSVVVCDL